jgi:hypothetical protein
MKKQNLFFMQAPHCTFAAILIFWENFAEIGKFHPFSVNIGGNKVCVLCIFRPIWEKMKSLCQEVKIFQVFSILSPFKVSVIKSGMFWHLVGTRQYFHWLSSRNWPNKDCIMTRTVWSQDQNQVLYSTYEQVFLHN